MRNEIIKKHTLRTKRAYRVRKTLKGSSFKPRLSVHKSNQHIQAQLIDDEKGVTLAMVGTFSKGFKGTEFGKKNKASAKKLGEEIAKLAIKQNIHEVVFDRGPFKYHGLLNELASAAREQGLKF